MGLALTPHDADELRAMLVGHGVEVPNSVGLFGGLEGSCNETWLRDGRWPRADRPRRRRRHTRRRRRRGPQHRVPSRASSRSGRGDVFAYSFQGGGGYGDPVDREPDRVFADVTAGLVSRKAARELYGVVLGGDRVDVDGTRARRDAIRRERLGGRPLRMSPSEAPAADGIAIGDRLVVGDDGAVSCRCGQELSAAGDWKTGAIRRIVEPAAHGPAIALHHELELREHVCPGCGGMLESEVARSGADDLVSIELATR